MFYIWFLRQYLQTHDRSNKREDEKQPPKGGRLVEYEDSNQHCAHCAYPCPYGIGCAKRQRLRCFGKQSHAHNSKNYKAAYPCPPFQSRHSLCPSETVSKSYLAHACGNQYYPIHNKSFLFEGGSNIPASPSKVSAKLSKIIEDISQTNKNLAIKGIFNKNAYIFPLFIIHSYSHI